MIIHLEDEAFAGMRIDSFLASRFSFSRMNIQQKILDRFVSVNGKNVKNSYKITLGEEIELQDEFFQEVEFDINKIEKYPLELDIVYEDKDLLVINKPKNLTVHPGAGNKNQTLVNALVNYLSVENLSDAGGIERLGIVHRLDKDTSGLMVVAKNNFTHVKLSESLKNRVNFSREYLALCYGTPVPGSGVIEKYMKKGSFSLGKMIICDQMDANARFSRTNYEVLKTFANGKFSLIRCKLDTGRTHQIRLHLSGINHSIVGDEVYVNYRKFSHDGLKSILGLINEQKGQMLHAYKLSFLHPSLGKVFHFEKEPPEEMSQLVTQMEGV